MRYLCDPHIVPSVVPADFSAVQAAAERSAYARALHIDVVDGAFAPHATWPETPDAIDAFRELASRSGDMAFSVHLMTRSPRSLGEAFARAGARTVIGHAEAFASPQEASDALRAWRSAGAAEAGLALKIDTPLSILEDVEGYDVVQLMSIGELGHQGEPFDDRALSRVEEVHAAHPTLLVAVDGGVSEANIEDLVRAGANRLVVGHVLAESDNPERVFSDMLERAMRGCAPVAAEAAA
jgi:ribulose-phosphate 3-epimerase